MKPSRLPDPSQTTLDSLLKRFGPVVQLDEICKEFFGLGTDKARERASVNRLPVPTFRCTESAKAPLMVHVRDLASLVDVRAAVAAAEWEKSQV